MTPGYWHCPFEATTINNESSTRLITKLERDREGIAEGGRPGAWAPEWSTVNSQTQAKPLGARQGLYFIDVTTKQILLQDKAATLPTHLL